jgi:predicted dehydrogenase
MGIMELLGVVSEEKVRYAIVGLGDIAQEDMMPGVRHTGNAEITAFITSDQVKARELGKKYGVDAVFNYEQFDEALRSGTFDAVYVATPNWRHAEFIVPALKAGIHVLTEKPLEVTTDKCRQIMEAAETSSAKLMVAYRLHFEPATLDTIDKIRSGLLGDVHLVASTFTQLVDPDNHRAQNGELAGPVLDMGPYPVNAARYIFGDEPTEVVSAVGTKHPQSGFKQDFFDTVAVTLRFPGNKLAQFNISYFGSPSDLLIAVGSEGVLALNPAYTFGNPLSQFVAVGENNEEHSFKNTDQFGGELRYFSECILNGEHPEPDGEEGYADVRVLEGILKALETGQSVALEPFQRSRRIDTERQKITLSAVSTPELVHAANPSRSVVRKSWS